MAFRGADGVHAHEFTAKVWRMIYVTPVYSPDLSGTGLGGRLPGETSRARRASRKRALSCRWRRQVLFSERQKGPKRTNHQLMPAPPLIGWPRAQRLTGRTEFPSSHLSQSRRTRTMLRTYGSCIFRVLVGYPRGVFGRCGQHTSFNVGPTLDRGEVMANRAQAKRASEDTAMSRWSAVGVDSAGVSRSPLLPFTRIPLKQPKSTLDMYSSSPPRTPLLALLHS